MYAHLVCKSHNCFGRSLLQCPSRNLVERTCKPLLQRDSLSVQLRLRISRRIILTSRQFECLLYIRNLGTRRISVLHKQTVDERLERRTNLTARLGCIVVLEVHIVYTADVCLDVSSLWLHRNKAGLQETLVVQHRVHRRHNSINVTVPRKYRHRILLIERSLHLLFRKSRLLHHAPSFSPAHSTVDAFFLLRCRY